MRVHCKVEEVERKSAVLFPACACTCFLLCLCVCVYVLRAYLDPLMCLFMSKRVRARESERASERERESQRESQRESEKARKRDTESEVDLW